MELRQLAYFEAVVRYGGFTRAAAHLHVAQPAVSAQIRRLEAELGTTLLERTTRRVALTHAGELLLARTRAAIEQLDRARVELDELARVQRGRLRVGASQGLAAVDVPRLLAQFHRRYPAVTLSLRTGLIAALTAELEATKLDVVLGPIHADLSARLAAHPLVTDALVLITPPGWAAPDGEPVAVDQLRDEPFVCLPAGSGLHTMLLDAAAGAGFAPRVLFETYGPTSIRELVSAGLGIALLSASNARAPGPPVHVYELTGAPAYPPIGLIHLKSRARNTVIRAWRTHLVQDRDSRS